MRLTHVSLFSGVGGIDLAAEWAGFETILFCEIDKYAQKVLRKHWPDVPLIEDVRNVTAERVMAYARCEYETEHEQQAARLGKPSARSRADRAKPPITLLTGGFPCQPVSVAGKRRGTEDDRWLWPEMLRVISEVRPHWVVAENVAGIVRLGLDGVLSDLEGAGYEAQTFLIPACAVNAPHRRDRVFIVAHSAAEGLQGQLRKSRIIAGSDRQAQGKRGEQTGSTCRQGYARTEGREDVADTQRRGLAQRTPAAAIQYDAECGSMPTREYLGQRRNAQSRLGGMVNGFSLWLDEPRIPRVATGIKHRVERLRCLGNAVVPQQIYPILKGIAAIEGGMK